MGIDFGGKNLEKNGKGRGRCMMLRKDGKSSTYPKN
jgi:hypothetical protein